MKYPFLEASGQRSADMLGLTTAGAIKIACYDEDTHAHAFTSCMQTAKFRRGEIKDKDTIKYYCAICNEYCRTRFIDIDYAVINRLAMQFKISPEDELHLPENLRIKVEVPQDEHPWKHKQEHASGPRKPLPPTLLLSKKVFEYSPPNRDKVDDIAEAIKIVGYIAAGIHGSVFNAQEALQSFMSKAQLKIDGMIANNEKYNFDLLGLLKAVDEFIEWTIAKHNALPHIKKIVSVEDAQLKAHMAIAEFAPKLLKPFQA